MSKQRSKKGSAGKWIILAVVCVLVVVFVAGLCLQVFAKSEEWKPSNWFTKDEETEQLPEEEGKEEVGDAVFVEDTLERGIRLMSSSIPRRVVSSMYQSSFRLQATVLPEDADIKNIKWSLAWNNAASTWANGKDVYEYMAIHVHGSEDAVEWDEYGTNFDVDITPSQAYGEEIVVTVTSEDNEEAYASKKFGYIKRLKKVNFTLGIVGVGSTDTLVFGDGRTYTFQPMPEWGVGTANPTLTFNNYKTYLMGGPDIPTSSKLVSSRAGNSFTSSTDGWKEYWKANATIADFRQHVAKFAEAGRQDILVFEVTASIQGSGKAINIYETSKNFSICFKIDITPIITNVASVELGGSDELFYF